MKSVYDEFFYVPKDGKVREKVFLARITVSVVLMLICLAAMSISAYAYFACNTSAMENIIQSTNFEATVSIVTVVDQNNQAVPVFKEDTHTQSALLTAGKAYTVTLRPVGTATTGFCVVSADGCEKVYHTQQLGVDGDEFRTELTFTVAVDQDTRLSIFAHWGTSSYYDAYTNKGQNGELYIVDGETLMLAVVPPQQPVTDEQPDGATSATTEESTTTAGETTAESTVAESTTAATTASTEDTSVTAETTATEPTQTTSTEE